MFKFIREIYKVAPVLIPKSPKFALTSLALRNIAHRPLTSRLFASSASLAPSYKRTSIPIWNKRQLHSAGKDAPYWTYPLIGKWFLFGSSLVFGIVVVGGITRLTESGLSITEWNAIRGMAWPGNEQKWQDEFGKYQNSPEYKLMNSNMTLGEFKRIYYWEWLHRNLGRTIGLVFLLPTIYFSVTKPSLKRIQIFQGKTGLSREVLSRWMSPSVKKMAWTCCFLVGFQGLLGWYMVKSGLETDILDTPNATPRVSQYRLAAHLGSAFVIYLLSTWQGLQILHEVKTRPGASSSEVFLLSSHALGNLRRFSKACHMVAGLTFITAMSGAFVAGLDAGLVYNTWPLMGERFIPSAQELFPQVLATTNNGHAILASASTVADKTAALMWPQEEPNLGSTLAQFLKENRYRNFFENPVTVQLDHRLLAYTTFSSITALWVWSNRLHLPPVVRKAAHVLMGAALAQVALGISTLVYLVPIELAASHQAGSLVLLTSASYLLQKTKQCLK